MARDEIVIVILIVGLLALIDVAAGNWLVAVILGVVLYVAGMLLLHMPHDDDFAD